MSRRSRKGAPSPDDASKRGSLSSFFNKVSKGVIVPESRAAATKGAAVVAAVAFHEEDVEAREVENPRVVLNHPAEFDEEEVNGAVAAAVIEQAQRHDAQTSERQKKAAERGKRGRAEAPDDLRASCFVFFRVPTEEEDQNRWYCLANDYQPCSGSVKKDQNAGAKTGNFVDHCINNHKEWFDLVQASFMENGKVGAQTQFQTLLNGAKSKQGTARRLEDFGVRGKKEPGKLKKELRLLLWAIKCNVPLSRFDDPNWEGFLKGVGVSLCGSKQLMRLVEPLYAIAEKLVTQEIAKAVAVSTAMDFWTSVAGDHYLALTYHWMDDLLNLRSALLDCVPFPGQAFGETIATVADARWDFHFKVEGRPEPMRGAIVSDRGANVRAARDALVPHDSENCFCHLLDSVVRSVYAENGMFHSPDFFRDLAVIDILAKGLRSKPMHMRAFQAKCPADVAHLVVVTDQTTRWEALVRECERALALKDGFNVFFHDRLELKNSLGKHCPVDVFEGSYWNRIECYKKLLEKFRTASKIAQSESEPTLCQVVKLIIGLEQYCQPSVEDFPVWARVKRQFWLAIEQFLRPEINKLCNVTKACLLDPRNHACVEWLGSDIYAEAWDELAEEAIELQPAQAGEEDFTAQIIKAEMGVLRKRMESVWKQGSEMDPVTFFREHMASLQRVIKVVCMYLSIPASAAKPERVWSFTGWLVTKQRNALGVDMVEAMAFIWDFTRQPFFNFDSIVEEVEKAVETRKESDAVKALARKEQKRAKN